MSGRAPLLVAVGFAVVAGLVLFFLVLPKSAEISRAEEDLATAQQQESALRAQVAALQEAQQEAPQLNHEIQKVEQQVPSTPDLPGLIRLLREAADRAAVDLFQFAPSPPVADPSGQYAIISTAVNVTGSYFALEDFLFRLESLPRAAKVVDVTIAPAGSSSQGGTTTTGPTPLSLQLTVEFYTSDVSAGPGSAPGSTTTTTTTGG